MVLKIVFEKQNEPKKGNRKQKMKKIIEVVKNEQHKNQEDFFFFKLYILDILSQV